MEEGGKEFVFLLTTNLAAPRPAQRQKWAENLDFWLQLTPSLCICFPISGVGWETGVSSFQEKPELHSRNLTELLNLFCIQSPVPKKTKKNPNKTAICSFTVMEINFHLRVKENNRNQSR